MKLDSLISRLQELRAKSSDGDIDVVFEPPHKGVDFEVIYTKVWWIGLVKLCQEDLFESCHVCISE